MLHYRGPDSLEDLCEEEEEPPYDSKRGFQNRMGSHSLDEGSHAEPEPRSADASINAFSKAISRN